MKYVNFAILVIVTLAACDRQLNPEYCFAHPEDLRCEQLPGPDAPQPCTQDTDCTGQVCDTAATPPVCVDCTATNPTLCPAETPVCTADNSCRACVTDDDCAAGVCLPDGSCPAAGAIIYAATNGSAAMNCGAFENPCTITQAVLEVKQGRSIVKLLPSAQDYIVTTSTGLSLTKDVTIDARGATIRKTTSGAVVTLTGANRIVTILGGVLKGGIGSSGHGVVCAMNGALALIETDVGGNEANGIDDTSCATTLDRVVIHNNVGFGITKDQGSLAISRSTIQNNADGGIEIIGAGTQFTIVNNVFWQNGSVSSTTGGLSIITDTSTTSRLEFNSFNGNNSTNAQGSAIHCAVQGFTAHNNVVFGNGDAANVESISGACQHTHSIVSPGALPTGAGNSAVDPMFLSAVTGDLRTAALSPTEGAGDPASVLTGVAAVDFDGDPRTSPPDIGIDEHP